MSPGFDREIVVYSKTRAGARKMGEKFFGTEVTVEKIGYYVRETNMVYGK